MVREMKHLHKIWRTFPPDLQELVLLHVPVSTLYKFRAVCKRWNNLLTSPQFRRSCIHPFTEAPHLLCIPKNAYPEYCPVLNPIASWGWMDLTFLNPALKSLGCNRIGKTATDSSLLCVQANSNNYKCKSLIVCNPLTKQWELLPTNPLVEEWPIEPPDYDQDDFLQQVPGVLAIQVRKDETYQVFTIGDEHWAQESSRLQMYDSRSRSWKLLAEVDGWYPLSGAFFNTLLYCLFLDEEENISILTYNIDQDEWQIQRMTLCTHLREERIIVVGHRLYFLGSTENRGFGVNEISSIHIYELDILTSKCFQIARMPNACVDALTRRKDFRCEKHSWAAIGHGDTIVFLAPFGNPVVYHIDRDTSRHGKWGLLPPLGDNWAEEMCLSSFSFSLVATVAGAS